MIPKGQPRQTSTRKVPTTARSTPTRRLSVEATPGRYTRTPAPPRKGIVRRIVNWLILLTIVGLPVASFFVKTPDGRTYADAYLKPAYHWVKAKIQPPAEEAEAPKAAEKSEIDKKLEAVLGARDQAQAWLQSLGQSGEEKAAEIAAEIEKRLSSLEADFSAVTTEISAEIKKPKAQRKTRLDPTALNQHFADFGKFYRSAALDLAKWKETVVRAEAKKAAEEKPKIVEAPIVAYDLRKIHAWSSRKPETWIRWKTAAGLEDHVLRTLTDEGGVVRVVAFADGKTAEQPDRLFSFGFARVLREEPVKIGETEIPCRVVESGTTMRWIPKEGRWADRLALKTVAAGQETVVTSLGEEEIPVQGQAKSCIRFEVAGAKFWGHEDVPGFIVRTDAAEAIAWGEEAKPEFPAPPKPEPAPAAKVDPAKPHPWASFKPGAWARRKTLFESPTAKSETGADTILVEVTDQHVVQKIETLGLDGGVMSLDRKVPLAAGPEKMVSLEALTVGATPHSCQVVEVAVDGGVQRLWLAVDGRLAALAVALKVESPNSSRTVTEIGERKVPVAGRELSCIALTYVGKTIDGPTREIVALSEEVPGFEVWREVVTQTPLGENRLTMRLIDFGSDPSRKTSLGVLAEDAASIERRKIDMALNVAESKVIQASGFYRELAEASKNPPADPAAIKGLLGKHDQAVALLTEARAGYTSIKDQAPESAKVDDKVAKIDRALEVLAKYAKELKARSQ